MLESLYNEDRKKSLPGMNDRLYETSILIFNIVILCIDMMASEELMARHMPITNWRLSKRKSYVEINQAR
jgi:hypothetical protein